MPAKLERSTRDELLSAIQDYAEAWKLGKEVGVFSPTKAAVSVAIDRHESFIAGRSKTLPVERETDDGHR